MKRDIHARIGILGAGAAGLSAAWYLKQKGYRHITVLEREDRAGGKCCSFEHGGICHDIGAVEFTRFYRRSMSLMKRLRVRTGPIATIQGLDQETMAERPPTEILGETGLIRTALCALKYFFLLMRHGRALRGAGHGAVPADLAAPFGEWLTRNGLDVMAPFFWIPLTCYGYGRLGEIPAVYALKYLNARNMMTVVVASACRVLGIPHSWPRRVEKGFQYFIESLAGTLGDVRTGVTVTRVTRNTQSGIRVEFSAGDKKATLGFDRLIIAFPPDLGSLESIGLDLTDEERALFRHVRYAPYYTTVCRVTGVSPHIYVPLFKKGKICLPAPCRPVLVYRQTEGSDIAVFYASPGADDQREEAEKVREIHGYIVELSRNSGRPVEILYTKKWDYFPHVDTEALRNGFYLSAEALQGKNGTYFTGALMGFESVEHAIAYSKKLVDASFP